MDEVVVSEVPDETFLFLRRYQDGCLLQHVGTGDELKLPGVWRLQFENGNGQIIKLNELGHDTDECEWTGNLMPHALRAPNGDPTDVFNFEVKNLSDNTSINFHQLLAQTSKTQVVPVLLANGSELLLECYTSSPPKGAAFLRWGISRLICHIGGDEHNGSWLTKTLPLVESFMEYLGFAKEHVRRSTRSVVYKGKYHGLDIASLALYDPEATLSSEGVLLLCVYAATSGKFGHSTDVFVSDRAKSVIDGLVSTFVDKKMSEVKVYDSENTWQGTITITDGMVKFANSLERPIKGARGLKTAEPIADYLMELARILRRPSQNSVPLVLLCGHCIRVIVEWIGATVDSNRGGVTFSERDHIDLPELYKKGSSRPRRISKSFKLQVSKECYQAPALRNAQQFLSARRMINGRVRGKGKQKAKGLQSKAGKNFCVDNMTAYMSSSRCDLHKAKHGYVGLDGTSVSGKDCEFYVFEAPELKLACWLPPKVRKSPPCPTLVPHHPAKM